MLLQSAALSFVIKQRAWGSASRVAGRTSRDNFGEERPPQGGVTSPVRGKECVPWCLCWIGTRSR